MNTSIGKKWNNGDQSGCPANRRVAVKHQEVIDAPVDDVFRLACPEMGAPWLFSCGSMLPWPEIETRRHTVSHDPARHRFDTLLVHGWIVIGRLQIEMHATDDSRTLAGFVLTLTALNEQGDALFDSALGDKMRDALRQVGRSVRQLAECPSAMTTPPAMAPIEGAGEGGAKGASHEVIVRGDPDECFALACPVAELKWIDGWCFALIYSDSGHNEDNNIFLEPLSGFGVQRRPGANTYWYTTLLDTEARRFHAVLLTPESVIARFAVEMDDLGDGRTRLRWTLKYTGLDAEGKMILGEPGFEARVFGMLDLLARSAQHYVETGNKYRVPKKRRAKVLISVIGAVLGRHVRRSYRRLDMHSLRRRSIA